MLSQYKFLFLWALEMIQIKTVLCKIPHTCVIAVQIHMKMLCMLVRVLYCTTSSTALPNCDFSRCAITRGKEPVSLRILHMLWNGLWCGSLWPGYPLVFCCSSHTTSMAEMYTKITLTCAPFVYVKDISNHTSMQPTQPQTYICMENWLVTVFLTTPVLIFILVLNWLRVVSLPPLPKWSLKHAPDICPNQCRKLCILTVLHFVQRTKISFLYLLKFSHCQQTKVAFLKNL